MNRYEPRHGIGPKRTLVLQGWGIVTIPHRPRSEEETTPHISLNALTGRNTFQTMRVIGHIVRAPNKENMSLQVTVANGNHMVSNSMCRVKSQLKNEEFCADMMVLPLRGCEMVLGIKWLSTLGDITCNFQELKMRFVYKGYVINLRVTLITRETSIQSAPTVLKTLLEKYADVFAIPKELPTFRSHGHKIPLKEGTLPINIRPYRHPPIQKDAIESMVQELLDIRHSQSSFSSPEGGPREDYFEICVPLYEASCAGDWESAKVILDRRPELVRFAINDRYETPLHVAASAEPTKMMEDFVENIVNMMEKEDLELVNKFGDTCLRVAAGAGTTRMARVMLNKHEGLQTIDIGHGTVSALCVSVSYGNNDFARHLYDVSKKMTGWVDGDRASVFVFCVKADMFDIALEILTDHPEVTSYNPAYCWHVLDALARKPDAFSMKERNILWKIIDPVTTIMHWKVGPPEKDSHALNLLKAILDIIVKNPDQLDIDRIVRGTVNDDGTFQNPSGVLFVAAELGNTKFVVELIRACPDQLLKVNDDGLSIFHIAIMNREEGIYNLLYEIGPRKHGLLNYKDKHNNNILHYVGITSNKMQLRNLSGASLIMQRELLWFKEVERMVPPSLRDATNKDGRTPYELFSEKNQDLVSQGLKWMKDCMLVATLIVTVAFAVAFTVPGGYNQENGMPIFIHESSFLVFVVADAISLFSSSTSLLVFLSIITSHHNQRDFMYSLPRKLMIGLLTLFISVASMMVTFATSFFVIYRNRMSWVPILMSIFAAIPVIIFAALQFPFLVDMFRSMYDSRYLFKPNRRMLYSPKPRI
ncbi:ankyrin repeat-containing protein [Tanacetum coccineum]